MDTIYAIATARGKAGVSVLRMSGPKAMQAAGSMCQTLPEARKAGLRHIVDPAGSLLDQALVLSFPAPHSFTGEDVVEFHLHGSMAVQTAVMRVLTEMSGLRLAEPGEFTRRALENDKLDLAQVEGLADLVEAETEAQRKQALQALSGALGERAEQWRSQLLRAAALLEATIDFADEDVPVDVTPEVSDLLSRVKDDVSAEIRGTGAAERVRDGFQVAILGAPNAGKSSLLNRIAGREAAIVSEIEGTTRDVIEIRIDLGGIPVTLLDTAGLRETDDVVERIGIERAVERALSSDLCVILDTGTDLGFQPRAGDIVVTAKGDLLPEASPKAISGKTGLGVDALLTRVGSVLGDRAAGAGLATRERHRAALISSVSALSDAQLEVEAGPERADMAAENIRLAIRRLESLVGRIDVEAVLGEIFSNFCLGK